MNSQIILNFIFKNYNSNRQFIISSVNAQKYIDLGEKQNEINIIIIDGNDNQVMNTYKI